MSIPHANALSVPPPRTLAIPRAARIPSAVAHPAPARALQADRATIAAAAHAEPPSAPSIVAPQDAQAARLARIAATKARSWHDEVIYMALTDRFHNGDHTNDAGTDPSDAERFHGGDWQGLIDKLDYLADLGVTTLWISPLQEQIRDFFGKDGFHGYWPKDYTKPEPSFGDVEKLRELVDKAHEKGLKVLVDLVVNHMGYSAPMTQDPAYHDWFHHEGDANLTLQWNMEKGKLSGLPDFAQENPVVSRWLIDQCKAWIDKADIDGFRLDAVRHVPIDFWKRFSAEIHAHAGNNFLLLGEVYDPRVNKVARFQNEAGMDSVFDFPLNFTLRDTIGCDKPAKWWETLRYLVTHLDRLDGEAARLARGKSDGDMRRLSTVMAQDNGYRRADLLVTLLDNHDMPRFATIAGDKGEQKLELGLALLMTMRGIPSVYYGTEVAMRGDSSRMRDDMTFGANPRMEAAFKKLAHIRRDSEALRRGSFEELLADRDVYAYARSAPTQTVMVALNNGKETNHREIAAPATLPDGTELHDLMNGGAYVVADGHVAVDLAPNQAVILAPPRLQAG